jgi:hypothetical protein
MHVVFGEEICSKFEDESSSEKFPAELELCKIDPRKLKQNGVSGNCLEIMWTLRQLLPNLQTAPVRKCLHSVLLTNGKCLQNSGFFGLEPGVNVRIFVNIFD